MLRRLLSVILSFTFIGILSATVNDMARAEVDEQSANFWLPFCEHAAKDESYQGDAFGNGVCAGLVVGLSYMGQSAGVCPPAGVTPRQAVRVVVQYINQRPARTNENFKLLAIEAMRDAWPCNH